MVRLLPICEKFNSHGMHRFQSHNGAIAANASSHPLEREHWFQSHNGAIAARAVRCRVLRCNAVSIPQWCDCCRVDIIVVSIYDKVSIPQWCDCCMATQPHQVKVLLVSIPQWCDCCLRCFLRECLSKSSFNPTMVRLLPSLRGYFVLVRRSFNPTMVRLLRYCAKKRSY